MHYDHSFDLWTFHYRICLLKFILEMKKFITRCEIFLNLLLLLLSFSFPPAVNRYVEGTSKNKLFAESSGVAMQREKEGVG